MNIELQTASAPVAFELERRKGSPRAKITVRVGEELVHVDTVNLDNAKDRTRFVDALASKGAGSVDDLDKQLMQIAATPEPAAAPVGDVKAEGLRLLDEATSDALQGVDEATIQGAHRMLASPDLMDEVVRDVQALGIAREADLIAALYLIFSSRLLAEPASAKVQGLSSSGKSYIIEKVGELIPPEAVVKATDMTPQSLFYLPPGALVHKLVLAGEKSRKQDDDAAEATRALREMISAKELRKAVVVKGQDGLVTLQIHQPGPISHVESTTLVDLFDEDANRCILLATDESAAQSRAVVDRMASRAAGAVEDPAPIMAKHHAAQRMLKRVNVVVPFADKLAKAMPVDRPQVRRAFGQLLALTCASALVHQHQRSEGPLEHGDTINATIEDYAIARLILLRPLGRSMGTTLNDAVLRFGEWLQDYVATLLNSGDREVAQTFTNADLGMPNAKCYITSAAKRREYLKKLSDVGYLNAHKPEKSRQYFYSIALDEVPDSDASQWLPLPEALL